LLHLHGDVHESACLYLWLRGSTDDGEAIQRDSFPSLVSHQRRKEKSLEVNVQSDPLQHPEVWRAKSLAPPRCARISSGYEALDKELGGGWPIPTLMEVLTDVYGIGEMQLIMPLLTGLIHQTESALVCWINPPFQPNAVALAQHGLMRSQHWTTRENLAARDALWCLEQMVRSRTCSIAVAWIAAATMAQLRRMKLTVTQSQTPAVIYRPTTAFAQPSPAAVRLRLATDGTRLRVCLLKVPGRVGGELSVPIDARQLASSAV
jgi:protein ImuA